MIYLSQRHPLNTVQWPAAGPTPPPPAEAPLGPLVLPLTWRMCCSSCTHSKRVTWAQTQTQSWSTIMDGLPPICATVSVQAIGSGLVQVLYGPKINIGEMLVETLMSKAPRGQHFLHPVILTSLLASIHSVLIRVIGMLEPIPADSGQEARYTLDWSSVRHKANIDKQ